MAKKSWLLRDSSPALLLTDWTLYQLSYQTFRSTAFRFITINPLPGYTGTFRVDKGEMLFFFKTWKHHNVSDYFALHRNLFICIFASDYVSWFYVEARPVNVLFWIKPFEFSTIILNLNCRSSVCFFYHLCHGGDDLNFVWTYVLKKNPWK